MICSVKEFLDKYHVTDTKIAIGVSGGSDSLALAFLAHKELTSIGYKLVILTVNHQLRPTAAEEARYVANLMKAQGLEHHTLVWQGEKPVAGIEEAARKARYDLMTAWCRNHQIKILLIAHQQEDQAETFFMRLQRGSGLDGLCGIRESGERDGIKILRPLLKATKHELQSFLRQNNIAWKEDESNSCDDFLRARIRKFIPEFCRETGISVADICATTERLQNTQIFLAGLTDKYLKSNFKNWDNAGYSCSLQTWLNFENEMQFRLFATILKKIGQKDYIPRAKSIFSLIEKITANGFKSGTLGGCEIILANEYLWIVPQYKNTAIYTKKLWEDYLAVHPKLKKMKIPYKMRISLIENSTLPKHRECV